MHSTPDATLLTQRVLHARPPAQVLAAFQQPELLAQWWGLKALPTVREV